MKKLLIALLLPLSAFAWQGRRVTFTGANPLPTTYSTSSPSLLISELPAYNKNILFVSTVSGIVCTDAPTSQTAPTVISGGNQKEVYILASEHVNMKDVGAIRNIYCRSVAPGAITNGDLSVTLW